MAKRSSVSASASTSAPKRKRSGGHKVGYDPAWKSTYPWLVPVESDGTVVGLQCQWCTTHSSERQRSRSGIWTTSPCTSLRKDCIERHSNSEVHARSTELGLNREQAVRDGGIVMAFQQQVVAQRKAVIRSTKSSVLASERGDSIHNEVRVATELSTEPWLHVPEGSLPRWKCQLHKSPDYWRVFAVPCHCSRNGEEPDLPHPTPMAAMWPISGVTTKPSPPCAPLFFNGLATSLMMYPICYLLLVVLFCPYILLLFYFIVIY